MATKIIVNDKSSFNAAIKSIRGASATIRATVQASMNFMLDEYASDNFSPGNTMRKVLADKKLGVKDFERYVSAHCGASFKDSKLMTVQKHGKRTRKPLTGKWYADKVTSADLRKQAAKAKDADKQAELVAQADAMDVKATLKAQWKVLDKNTQYIANLEKALDTGNVDNADLLKETIAIFKDAAARVESLALMLNAG